MSTAVNPVSQSQTAAAGTTPAVATNNPLANESTFLTLLVSQLKNQDPLSPVDSTQFVSQLTSYSQLEQLIGIHKDTTSLNQPPTGTAAAAGSESPASGSSNPTASK